MFNRIYAHTFIRTLALVALFTVLASASVIQKSTLKAIETEPMSPSTLREPESGVAPETLPDLSFRRAGVLIGKELTGNNHKTVTWGGTVTLTKADSFLQSGGKLAFNFRYFFGYSNPSQIKGSFTNRIRNNSEVISQQPNQALTAGEVKMIDTQFYLAPGQHVIYLFLDDDKTVKESDEKNNVNRLVVIVNVNE